MVSLLLALIYLAFISLGLPDSLLGSAWPSMHLQLGVPLEFAGVITIVISASTIISSLASNTITNKIGTKWVVSISVLTTALALFGFSIASNWLTIILLAIPYGLGAGSIDAALNNYVALHYSSKHMNWLHAFWGVGASISPFIMGYAIDTSSWEHGYQIVSVVQIAIALLLFASLPLWQKNTATATEDKPVEHVKMRDALRVKGVGFVLLLFFCYCAIESTAGIWASSYFNLAHGLSKKLSANLGSLYYIGIMSGRIICGFVSNRIGSKKLIHIGLSIMVGGIIMLVLPLGYIVSAVAMVLLGLGSAPIYPAIIHTTPTNFGAKNSQAIIGLQMAFAYTGSTLMPPLFGLIGGQISMWFFAPFMAVLLVVMVVSNQLLNRTVRLNAVDIDG